MIFSALAILSFAAQPAYAASGNFTTDPSVFAVSSSTVVVFSGSATFTSGATVTFYVNTVDTFPSGAVSIGTLTLPAGVDSLTGLTTTFNTAGLTPGTYYLAATDGSGFASGGTITVTSLTPEISLSGSTEAGHTAYVSSVTGHPFDPSSTIDVFLNYAGSSYELISSITTNSAGYLPTNSTTGTPYFEVPTNEPEGVYSIVAQEMSTSLTSPNSQGITADASLSLTPSITVTISGADSISGSTFSSFTISGEGFVADAVIAASTSTSPTNSVTVGGVDAILSGSVTIGPDGSFSDLKVTGLVSSISSTGPQTIVITTTPATSFNSFPNAIYVSRPTGIPSITVTDIRTGSNSGYVGDEVSVVAYNFLSGESISVNIGGTTLTSPTTTDVNGFFSASPVSVPQIPGGSYTVFAVISSGGEITEYASTLFRVLPDITFSLAGYYAATGASATVTATGLSPNTEYAITDTGYISDGGTGNIFYDHYVLKMGSVTISPGTLATDKMGVVSTASGTFTVSYEIEYSGLSTGSNQTVTVTGGSLSPFSSYYYAIGPATLRSSSLSYNPAASPSQTVTISISGLIPFGSLVTSGITTEYSLVLSGVEALYVSANGKTPAPAFETPTGSVTLTFASSEISLGEDELIAVYSGTSTSVGDVIVIGSTPGTSAGYTYPYASSESPGAMLGYYLYNYPAFSTVNYYYYTTQGKQSSTATTDANGAANVTFPAPFTPAGVYNLAVSVTVSGVTKYSNSSFTVDPTLSSVPSTNSSYPVKSATTFLFPNQNVTLYAYGLSPESYYGVYAYDSTSGVFISDVPLATFETDNSGSYSSGITVTLPVAMVSGDTIELAAIPLTSSLSISSAVAEFTFTAGTYNNIFGPTFNYTTNTESAFPGQLVNFAWTPSSPPSTVGGTYGPIEVTVYLNGTAYVTEPAYLSASGTLYGSFPMPNDNPGAYWTVTLGWTQIDYASSSGVSASVATFTMSSAGAPTLELVNGSGALVVSLTTSTFSQITAIIKTVIGTYVSVPLSELNASIASIKGMTANLTTAFGKMTVTLSAINATVSSIENGQALINTKLGTISTTLSSINASIVSLHDNVAVINTTLGQVTASLKAINATVSSIMNGQAVINTTLGKITA
ncbi:MAG: hypothetical protein QW478_11990, partial [Candidatus Micrarchaeaceae archaeon]